MAVTTTFKQECPTGGATVKIDEKMLGKKVECTKCKDKFVAERSEDDDDEAPRGKKKAGAANRKKPAKDEDDVEEVDVDEDEPVQTKASKGKAGSNGKAKKDDDESDDEPEAKGKGKSKKGGGSNKLTIGLSLAVVGVLMLGVVLFFLLRQPKTEGGGGGRGPGALQVKKDEGGGDKTPPVTPAENPKTESTTVPLNDAELAKLSNLLPEDTDYVFRLFFKDLFGPSGTLHEAVFKTDGALRDAVLKNKLGFSLASVDDVIHAERYAPPSWKYTVIHFKDALDEKKLKTALNLKLAGMPIKGQTYYKMTEAHPVFDVLGRFSFGIPNWYRSLEPRRADQPTLVRIHNAQTLIVGDEKPVLDFLNAEGQFPLQTPRSTPAPAPVAPPTTTPTTPTTPTKPMPAGPGGEMTKPKMPGKGKGGLPSIKGKGMPVPPGQSLEYRPGPDFAEFTPDRFGPTPVAFPGSGQEILMQDANNLASKLPGTAWKGNEKPPSNFFTLTFADSSNVKVTSDVFMVADVPGAWSVNSKGIVEITSPKIPGVTYRCELVASGQFKVTGSNSQTSWEFTVGQTGGSPVELGAQAPKQDAAPGAGPAPGAAPSAGGPMVVREDMYLTIRPVLKTILDRVEARSDSQDKVLMSSTVDMVKSIIPTNLPEFRNRVVRHPRQFWDITVMLSESTPRIRTLGTAVIQHGETQRYQLRNEISCTQESEAVGLKKEIMETTSFGVAQFLEKLVNHKVRLPELPKKDVKKAPADPKKAAAKTPTVINFSQMTVNQEKEKVDFQLDLVLDNATLSQLNSMAALTAGAVRVETEAAASKSVRHWLARAGKTVADKGMSDRDVPPGRFPPGAFLRSKTPFHVEQEPRNRISWMAGLLPYMGQQHLYNRLDFNKSWREPENWMAGNTIVPQFLDPSYPDYLRRVSIGELPLDFGATHYVGVAGIGLDAASYSRSDPATVHKRGIFSYDGSASLDEIQKGRGLSNTMMMIQVPHDGVTGVSPWIAGGGATLRGVPEKNSIAPFILSRDKNDKPIEHQGKRGTYVSMADMSVRFVDQTVSDDVFKAMATVQGPTPESFNLATNPATPLVPAPEKDDVPPPPPVEPSTPSTPEKKPSVTAFVVPGQFSVDTPAGFTWKYVETKTKDGRTAKIYGCFKPSATVFLSLDVEERKLDTDEQKRKLMTEDMAKAITDAKKDGVTLTEDIKPNLQSPIPARIEYRFIGKLPNGTTLVAHGKTIFGRAIYNFTAMAATKSDAEALLKVADSFKELPPGSGGAVAKQSPPAAVRHRGEGRVYDKDHKFSIVPPNGWQRGPSVQVPGATVQAFMYIYGPKAEITPNLNVIEVSSEGATLEVIVTQAKKLLPANRTITDDGFVTIDGKQAFRISHKGPTPINGKNVEWTVLQYVVVSTDNRAFIVTFGSAPGEFANLRKSMEESALSIQID